jgi:hypothetical protein
MTDLRKLPLERGLAWFLRAVNVGRKNPKAVFGAAMLLIVALYALSFVLLLPVAWNGLDSSGSVPKLDIRLVIPLFVALVCVFPVLLGGLMHVIREVEADRPVRARDVFVPARAAVGKNLLLLGVVQLILNLAATALVFTLAGSGYWSEYLSALQGAMSGNVSAMPEPAHPLMMFLVNIVFNYLSAAILLLSIPLVLFSGVGLQDAIRLSLRSAWTNLRPNVVAAALFMIAAVAAVVVVGTIALLAGSITALIHPVVGVIVLVAFYLVFGTALMAVMAACAHAAWSDIFDVGAGDSEVAGPASHFEA